jgi:hypothetical protein
LPPPALLFGSVRRSSRALYSVIRHRFFSRFSILSVVVIVRRCHWSQIRIRCCQLVLKIITDEDVNVCCGSISSVFHALLLESRGQQHVATRQDKKWEAFRMFHDFVVVVVDDGRWMMDADAIVLYELSYFVLL